MTVRWEEPPQTRSRHDWPEIIKQLRKRPGKWAMVATYSKPQIAYSTARAVRDGLYQGIEAGTVEARARTVDGEARVYARYVGEPS